MQGKAGSWQFVHRVREGRAGALWRLWESIDANSGMTSQKKGVMHFNATSKYIDINCIVSFFVLFDS